MRNNDDDGGNLDNHTSTDLLLDLDQQVYPPDQILLIMFEMCFNYVVKIISSEFS